MAARPVPIGAKLVLVLRRPFHHEAERTRLQCPLQHGEGTDIDDRPLGTIAHVKVWRRMIVVEHGR
jgi:hypothetical protein